MPNEQVLHALLAVGGAGVGALGSWLLIIGRRGVLSAWSAGGVWTARRNLRCFGWILSLLVGAYLMFMGVLGAVGGGMGFLYL